MENLKIRAHLVDDSIIDFDFDTGRELINTLFSDDWAAPPRSISFEATSESGKIVSINIPYGDDNTVFISIDGEPA